jgi:hypothetical protein
MVHKFVFQTSRFGYILEGLGMVILVYFVIIWYMYFVVIWYIFPILVSRTRKNLATLINSHDNP